MLRLLEREKGTRANGRLEDLPPFRRSAQTEAVPRALPGILPQRCSAVSLRAFVPALSTKLRLGDQALLERDVRLHLLLGGLSGDERIGTNLVFKGGACLIKCHFGYWRFTQGFEFFLAGHRAVDNERSQK